MCPSLCLSLGRKQNTLLQSPASMPIRSPWCSSCLLTPPTYSPAAFCLSTVRIVTLYLSLPHFTRILSSNDQFIYFLCHQSLLSTVNKYLMRMIMFVSELVSESTAHKLTIVSYNLFQFPEPVPTVIYLTAHLKDIQWYLLLFTRLVLRQNVL